MDFGRRSSTFSQLSFTDDEDKISLCSNCRQPLFRRRQRNIQSRLQWLLIAVLVVAVVSLSQKQRLSSIISKSYHHAFLPTFRRLDKTYLPDHTYVDTGAEGDHSWSMSMPKGGGFVAVPDPKAFEMHESMPINFDNSILFPDDFGHDNVDVQVYGLTVTHQLHCLGDLRHLAIDYQNGVQKERRWGHLYHCLNYIRWGLMCNPDLTLEWGRPHSFSSPNDTDFVFSGVGTTHQCTDWDAVADFLVEHRVDDRMDLHG